MKVTWQQVGVLALIVFPVTLLIGLGKEADSLMQWLSIMVPSVLAGAAYSEAQKARQNTNGRMSELIRIIREMGATVKALGGKLPEGFEKFEGGSDGNL